ncbi:MAG TPA: D-glycero-beta-D-manno-heptose 1,7-bisphosphate 7-phosphatase [Gammaproteobacteria bacterium]
MTTEAGPLVILDRDGVINYDSDAYIKSPDEWRPLPGSLAAIAALTKHGRRVIVVSNQSGVGRGLFSEAVLAAIHAKMLAAIEAEGGAVSGVYYCPHLPKDKCACRKPAPGMLQQIGRDFGCALTGVPFVGDKVSDVRAAQAVHARPILVRTGSGRAALAELRDSSIEVYDDLAAAVAQLLPAQE